ncbi:PTS lactose/cellobiose transporter subunit IIA [Lacticaseibacillus pabuli]|uniref:PTS lactose/cellobiose transporter subunit IIA n=1 Tax=Lacticaseibacillus pabuli TaxID=3025672 RepID=A0ABY7WTN6_9LACO|nr:PTS lactose/cellobiose transporter subunit IIA [Lacticaseibacillus sp. KACC 23028]WDF83476.1 PTS lactose/cellobiose transporter subunit IIA [Lacticaseibacillus sp. KACC 23028]
MIPDENPSEVMEIIMNASHSRSASRQAMAEARVGKQAAADKSLAEAKTALQAAQDAHNTLLSQEARGEGPEFSILLVHAENHLANADTMIDIATEFMAMGAELNALQKKLGK